MLTTVSSALATDAIHTSSTAACGMGCRTIGTSSLTAAMLVEQSESFSKSWATFQTAVALSAFTGQAMLMRFLITAQGAFHCTAQAQLTLFTLAVPHFYPARLIYGKRILA